MPKQLYLNNFESQFVAAVKDVPTTGTPATEAGYGILNISFAAAPLLTPPTGGDHYIITALKRAGSVESDIEIMKVTAVDSSSGTHVALTVQRAQEGTTAKAYAINDYVSMRFTKGGAENLLQAGDSRLTATATTFTPAGALASTTVQAALVELDTKKQPAIAAGTTDQFWRGDKTWVDFATTVRATVLTGLSLATNAAITAADTVLGALGKLQKQITDHFGAGGTAHANVVAAGAAGFMTGADKTKLDGVAPGATANTGTVTSVGLSLPAEFTVSGSPVTATGTLTASKASQTANYFWAAPNGAGGEPTFRAIVAADVPTLNQNTTGSAATLTTPRTINGTSFNGSAAITTANWGTARTITLGSTGKSVDGSAAVTWTLAEMGAAAASATVNLTGNQSVAGVKTFSDKDVHSAGIQIGAGWSVTQSGTDLMFNYGGTNVFKISSAGAVVAKADVTGTGTV